MNPETECFNGGTMDTEEEYLVAPGETVTCDTNVEFPGSTSPIEVVVNIRGGDKSWDYPCNPSTSTSQTC